MNRKIFLLILLLFFAVVSASAASDAASPFGNRNTDPAMGVYMPPAVFVKTGVVDKVEDGKATGSFRVLNNGEQTVGDIQYRIEILTPLPKTEKNVVIEDTASVFDKKYFETSLTLLPKEEKNVSFTYVLPKIPGGEYRLRIQLTTSKGRDLGWRDLGFTAPGNEKIPFVQLVTGAMHLPEYPDKNIPPDSGPNIAPNSKFEINASGVSAVNLEAIPVLDVFEFQTSKKIDSIKFAPVSFVSNKDRPVSLDVTAVGKPGVYYAQLTLQNGNGVIVSPLAEYKWIVRGSSAQIMSVRVAEKPTFAAGSRVPVAVEYVGPADAETKIDGKLKITISDEAGIAGTFDVPEVLKLSDAVGGGTANVSLKRGLSGTVKVKAILSDTNGNVLDSYEVKFSGPEAGLKVLPPVEPLKQKPVMFSKTIIVSIVIVLLILALVIASVYAWIRKRKIKNIPTTILTFLLLFAIVRVALGNGLEVLTPIQSRNFGSDWTPLGSTPVVQLTIVEPIHDQSAGTYSKSAVPFSYKIEFAVCTNSMAGAGVWYHYLNQGGLISTFKPASGLTYALSGSNSWTDDWYVDWCSGDRCMTHKDYVAPAGLNLSGLVSGALNTTFRMLTIWDWNADANGVPRWTEPSESNRDYYYSHNAYINLGMANAVNIWLNFGPNIVVSGQNTTTSVFQPIANADTTPTLDDGTDFGNTNTKITDTGTFQIKNTDAGSLNITDIRVENLDGTVSTDFVPRPPLTGTLTDNATQNLYIDFTPLTVGIHEANVKVFSNDPDTPIYQFRIKGNATAAPCVEVTCDSVVSVSGTSSCANFSSKNAEEVDITYKIKNTGTDVLTLTAPAVISTSGQDTDLNTLWLVKSQPTIFSLAVNQETIFVEKFQPINYLVVPSTPVAGKIRVWSNAANNNEAGRYVFNVSGNVLSPDIDVTAQP
jgi:hypothetical protein